MAKKEGKAAPAADNKTMMLVAYIFTWLSGLIVYFTAGKEDPEVRFHAVQAILLGVVAVVLCWTFIGPLLIWLYGLYIGYTAYSKGERIMVPVLGEYAVKYSEKPA